MRSRFGFCRSELSDPLLQFIHGIEFKRIQQIVCFDALSLPARHFDMRALSVLRCKFDTELPGAFGRQRDDFVRKVNRSASLLFVSQGEQPVTNDVLQIRLAYVDHVVDSPSVAERRMIWLTIT